MSWFEDPAWRWVHLGVGTTPNTSSIQTSTRRSRLAAANEGNTPGSGTFAIASGPTPAGGELVFERWRIDGPSAYGGVDRISLGPDTGGNLFGADGDVAPDVGTRYLWVGAEGTQRLACMP